MNLKRILISLSCLAFILTNLQLNAVPAVAAGSYPPGFSEVVVAGGLNLPIALEFAPDGRIFVAEKNGAVRIIENGNLLPIPFAQLTVDSSVERGLLGLTLDPNFATNGNVYVHYTNTNNPVTGQISRLTANPENPNLMAAGSEKVLISGIPSDTAIHDGGEIKFGLDGKLYIPTGDAGFATARYSQDMQNLGGKILRINSDGSIPNDNPFLGNPNIRPEIYASGLRSPFTMAVEPGTGRMFVNDVGFNAWEEINEVQRGANYGWPICEGRCNQVGFTNPVYQYDHNFGRSITGGAFYTGNAYPAEYNGDYFFADYSNGFIKNLDFLNGGTVSNFGNGVNAPVNLKVGPDGLLYFPSLFSGDIIKIQYRPQIPPPPAGEGNGIYATYFNNKDLAGAPVISRVDTTINFDYQGGSPGAGINNDLFSARWTGEVLAQYTEAYTFTARADDGVRLYVDNKLVVDKFIDQPATDSSGTINLVAGQKYSIRMEYFESYGNAVAQLSWASASQPKQIIPKSQLFSRPPGQAPTATIDTPNADGASYSGGDTITYSGSAIDPEDGVLPASAYSWEIVLHHDRHIHPFIGPVKNTTNGTFTIPVNSEASSNSFYEIKLTVTDSSGQTNTQSRLIAPKSASITYSSNIAGASILLDSQPITTPQTEQNVTGVQRSLGAAANQTINGKNYRFVKWSDDGAANHIISIPAVATTYTAIYEETTASPPPQPTGTIVKVYAAGTPASGVYPTAELLVDDQVVSRFENIRGNPNTREFMEFSYTSPVALTGGQVKVRYINDVYAPPEDRNLRVDKIVIGQTTYETEAPSVLSTGTYTPETGCAPGNKTSEWLQCGGFFRYGDPAPSTPTPQPTPQPTGSTISVFAAGTPAQGIYPNLDITADGQSIQKINDIRGNPDSRQFQQFTFTTATKITIGQLQLNYTNDLVVNGEDRNLRIDRLIIDGVEYQVEAPTTLSTGTWSSQNGCAAGNKQSEWLHCGGYFKF